MALLDVVVGGVMLGIGLSAVMTMTTRALSRQTDGEKRMTAAWLADEMLNMVLVEGPERYARIHDTSASFDPPFDEFSYELDIDDVGLGLPFRVTAIVRWPAGDPINEIRVESRFAVRKGDPEQPRAPLEPVDRDARYFDDDEDAAR